MLSAKSFNTFFYPNKWFTQCNSVTGLKLTKNKDTEDEQANYEKQLHGNEHLNIAILTNWQQKSIDVVGSLTKTNLKIFQTSLFLHSFKDIVGPTIKHLQTQMSVCSMFRPF